MTLADWIPAVSVPAVLGLVAYLARTLILTRLKGAVTHEYDAKLASLKSDLEAKQTALKAELHAKQAQLDTFRNAVLSGVASRQAAVDKRRLEAVDQLWEAVRLLGFLKGAATFIATVHFEKLLAEAERNPKAKEFAKPFEVPLDKMTELGVVSHKARPYLSGLAWAYFSAYQAILLFAVAQMNLLKYGLNEPKLLRPEHVVTLANAALPGYEEYLAKNGTNGAYYLLDELERKLLDELTRSLKEGAGDAENVGQVAAILTAVDDVSKDTDASKHSIQAVKS
jgi:hypothetical protein